MAAFAIFQPAALAAKSYEEISGQIAYEVTVQINSSDDGDDGGSGVIVGKQGNTYTVITCVHVVESKKFKDKDASNLSILTHDGKTYPLVIVKKLGTQESSDLAVVSFTSSVSYSVATIGNSDEAKPGSPVFVSGYPAELGKTKDSRKFQLNDGPIKERLLKGDPPFEPYTMRYVVRTENGMSGGPVFDADGRVVGIHGQGDQTTYDRKGNKAKFGEITRRNNVNAAVPINTFKQLKSQFAVNIPNMKADNSRSTVNPDTQIQNPQTAKDYYYQGVVREQPGNKQQAVDSYTEAIKRDPNIADAYFRRGNIRFDQGDLQGAIADFDRAISLNPNYTNAYYNRAAARYNLRDKQGALADFDAYLTRSPNDFEAYFQRGSLRRSLGDVQGTVADFDQVVRLVPEEPKAYYNRGIVRREMQDAQGAIADLQKAVELFKQQGIQEEDRGFYQKAQELIQTLQPAGGAATPQPTEPGDNSGQFTPGGSNTQPPQPTGETGEFIRQEPATEQPQSAPDNGW